MRLSVALLRNVEAEMRAKELAEAPTVKTKGQAEKEEAAAARAKGRFPLCGRGGRCVYSGRGGRADHLRVLEVVAEARHEYREDQGVAGTVGGVAGARRGDQGKGGGREEEVGGFGGGFAGIAGSEDQEAVATKLAEATGSISDRFNHCHGVRTSLQVIGSTWRIGMGSLIAGYPGRLRLEALDASGDGHIGECV
jgi:hypothetical protein